MVSTSFLRLTLFILFMDATIEYQITSNTKIDEFPIQIPHPYDNTKFLRIFNDTKKELQCPESYIFGHRENHCIKQGQPSVKNVCLTLELPDGDNPDPDNCQKFYSCNSKYCCHMTCPPNLVFNKLHGQCLYPRDFGCCEYIEKNPGRLVQ